MNSRYREPIYIVVKDATKRPKIARRGEVAGYRVVLTREPGVDADALVATLNSAA